MAPWAVLAGMKVTVKVWVPLCLCTTGVWCGGAAIHTPFPILMAMGVVPLVEWTGEVEDEG